MGESHEKKKAGSHFTLTLKEIRLSIFLTGFVSFSHIYCRFPPLNNTFEEEVGVSIYCKECVLVFV